MALLGSPSRRDWEHLGQFLGRVRQARRKAKLEFERLAKELQAHRFVQRKAAWKAKGMVVCRHGVLWKKRQLASCPCMSNDIGHTAWIDARWMPALDHASQCLIVTPFDEQSFSRLGVLQAEMRRLGW